HHLHPATPRQVQHAAIETAPDRAEAVHRVDLRGEHGDLVDVLNEAGVTALVVHVVEQPLERLLGGGGRGDEEPDTNVREASHGSPPEFGPTLSFRTLPRNPEGCQ